MNECAINLAPLAWKFLMKFLWGARWIMSAVFNPHKARLARILLVDVSSETLQRLEEAESPRAAVRAAEGCSVCCKSSWSQLQDLCRLEKLSCALLGVTRKNLCDFEVEYLCDYKRVRGEEHYLVKWKGYPESENTWEPRCNLKCLNILKQFHKDLEWELVRRGSKPHKTLRCLDLSLSSHLVQKAKQRRALRLWERHLNAKRNHRGAILVTNEVDLEGPPRDFVYINEYRVGEGITLNQVAVGCECRDCYQDPSDGCCPGASLNRFAYNDQGQVKIRAGLPIYECNSRCHCSPACPNRVVQQGIQYDLCIFRTGNGRGWGVRTLQKIRKNSFVMEYVGEIITSEEAERRGQIYDRQGATYLFDLDYVEDVYTVDAAYYGNISHFVNHSCDPNLQVYNVFIDNLDERLPRIAFFATRTIRSGEELTFDYNMQVDPVDVESTRMDSNFGLAGMAGSPKKRIRMECKCGTQTCRKYLF
ncbi:histone-lysine N-methyltransferase SUV39H1 isoform X2 [Rhinatrema bivittatum]|uniref:histone-lysine N-methyltransferase SUV39H1 isoform X2 n=1 Tax=Rhinatrema bivittatum TaxID=194408 RepID=UPI001128C0E8|nr:histone-lysine N-methyltransferase SUV39H1 isoform X2 [Rhinatrema bivittatum]